MRKTELKPGTEYAVHYRHVGDTLYRARYVEERLVEVKFSRVGRPAGTKPENRLVFAVVAEIDRPPVAAPKVGQELLVASARLVVGEWEEYVERSRLAREDREARKRQDRESRRIIAAAMESLGLTGLVLAGAGSREGYRVNLDADAVVALAERYVPGFDREDVVAPADGEESR